MHGRIALLDPSMVLLQAIIEVFISPMKHLPAQRLTHCSWVGSMFVRCHLFWRMANNSERLLEKLLSCLHLSLFTQARIHQVAIGINGAIEILPFPPDACP